MEFKVITFYKYIPIQDPLTLMQKVKAFCEKHNILGRILLGCEGINGAMSGPKGEVEKFKSWIKEDTQFLDLTFREQLSQINAYHKLVIRVRKEIVSFGEKVNLKNKGNYITPKELKSLYDNNEDFVIIDARNDYEFKVGHFEDAIDLSIKSFREFPTKTNTLECYKEKKIVMYCTGGIRCEKASAYLKEQGFLDVSHLEGGIIEFNHAFPGTNFKGTNFVFDDRLIEGGKALQKCEICKVDALNYQNCNNLDCDRLFACCEICKQEMKDCCKKECMDAPRQRKKVVRHKEIGKVLNYFSNVKVAVIDLDEPLLNKTRIGFRGKTTPEFFVDVRQMYNEAGKEIERAERGHQITICVNEKVRKNDIVILHQ